ncbi:hypothetical protein WJ96_05740 [Burkholderia ubonensis]|uniref:Uncharacterized protein n=1 Tax=Burkholderia ubonensis TaxID=101571 RepID=A0AAW3MSY5_9BURK|nr:hypothetical protein [Burkholderia ubonensis]KVP75258.1 hypothetical protein WJ93_07535 [Burkholderia ubonensis]KVP98071.1 hypothetical protein WJ96_05740 [Burkholderia ubonensis]KVZ92768.1 hypothetical protein WL25_17400 [Burkholderia ubonensis]
MAFKKMDDPQVQARIRSEEAQQLAHGNTLRVAVEACEAAAALGDLTDKERGLVQSCRERFNAGRPLTEAQEKWLLDIARRVRDDLAEEIDLLIHHWGNGDHTGEHPTYRRSAWPLVSAKDLEPTAYWVWVLSEIQRNGGEEEHCSECASQLNGDAWNGLCGNCADSAENESEHSHTA